MKLKGKVALITGGGSGIGMAIADRFVAEGAKVCITGRQKKKLDKVAQSLPSGTVAICPGDVSREDDVKRMVETAVMLGSRLDVLVNNAAINQQGSIADLSLETWRSVIEVNLTGPYLLMKAAIPYMLKGGGGSIINIASIGGMRCLPNMPAYCSSKAALIMLTQQVALDYGRYHIRCNVVCPGGVKTDMTEKEFGQLGKMLGMETESFFTLISSETPLRRFAEPHETAGICSYLASDDSSFMTGSVIPIDGGTSIVSVVGASIKAALRRGGVVD